MRIVPPEKVFAADKVRELVPVFVIDNVPDALLIIPERISSWPPAFDNVFAPILKLLAVAVLFVIVELIVRATPKASRPELLAVIVTGRLNVATLL